jgi:hypothetical protein
VDQRGGIEHDGDGKELPEQGVEIDSGRKRIHRDVAERVVDEMADQIGEQHQPARQTDLADADPADELTKLGLGGFCHVVLSRIYIARC